MLEEIDIRSSVAAYVQIENQIQFAVASGRLKPGEKLPSVHELSARLHLNPNTVAKAYRDLEVMGILYTRRGMGVFVNKGTRAKCEEDCRSRIIGRIHEVVAEAKASGITQTEFLDITKKCFASDSRPYSEPPASLMALAKPKARSR